MIERCPNAGAAFLCGGDNSCYRGRGNYSGNSNNSDR